MTQMSSSEISSDDHQSAAGILTRNPATGEGTNQVMIEDNTSHVSRAMFELVRQQGWL